VTSAATSRGSVTRSSWTRRHRRSP